MPLYFLEREILPTRLGGSETGESSTIYNILKESMSNGEIIALYHQNSSETKNLIKFLHRGSGSLFDSGKSDIENTDNMIPELAKVYQFLKEYGASPFQDIEAGTNLPQVQLINTLEHAVRMGLVTTDNHDSFLLMIGSSQKQSKKSYGRTSRHEVRQNVKNYMLFKSGRWFLTSSFAVMGKKISINDKLERQARLLLKRYGILVKEFYRREVGFLPWYQLFQILKKLEWQGEIRRGYFIEGLSGIQFAVPEAVELLSELPEKQNNTKCHIISTIDPALPFGGNIDWGISGKGGEQLEIRRSPGNHIVFMGEEPVFYSENYASRLWIVKSLNIRELETIFKCFKNWLRLSSGIRAIKKIQIDFIDNKLAVETDLARIFYSVGFEKEGSSVVLWPSGI